MAILPLAVHDGPLPEQSSEGFFVARLVPAQNCVDLVAYYAAGGYNPDFGKLHGTIESCVRPILFPQIS